MISCHYFIKIPRSFKIHYSSPIFRVYLFNCLHPLGYILIKYCKSLLIYYGMKKTGILTEYLKNLFQVKKLIGILLNYTFKKTPVMLLKNTYFPIPYKKLYL